MKPAELVSHLLVATLSEQEVYYTVLGHMIKTGKVDVLRVDAELDAGDRIGQAVLEAVPALGLVKSNRGGKPKDPNSARSIIEGHLREHGSATKGQLTDLIVEKRGWDRIRASMNVNSAGGQLSIVRDGYGESGIWKLPEEAAA